ncbi:Coenzyme F420 hydrogenase/dehydrogenase, beta subunit C-terminal domain [Ruminococcus sp. TM463]|nr:Coenzyme F420 hydrogenase/dehydrogenase, beta subunit C-terminal domain [Ruminococcus sp. TM463]
MKILNFVFRDKYKSASSHYYRLEYQDLSTGKFQTKRDIYMTFPYYYAYQDRITCRKICYSCPYATENRVGDITIGDFHRVNHYEPDIDRFSCVSMFVCNTKNGEDFFKSMQQHLIIKEYDWDVIKMNNRFSGIETPPAYRIDYLSLVANNQMEKAYKKYLNYKMDWRYYYYHLPGFLRRIGNKILRRAK